MKALSIREPWAWLIIQGFKDIENRYWPTNYRGRIYVHAAKRYGTDELADASWIQAKYGIALPDSFAGKPPSLGCIVGEVDIIDCVEQSQSSWFEGPYGFVLSQPVAYETPVPYRGQLGLFAVKRIW